MIFKLTKFRRDGWSGHTTYTFCSNTIVPELGKRGKPATGMTDAESKKMEKDLFLQAGELSENSPYWVDYIIPLPESGLDLDDENASDRLMLYVLRCMKKVAVGNEDKKKKSKAQYVLTSPQTIEKEDADKYSVKERAYELYFETTDTTRKQIYVVLMKSKKNGQVVDTSSMTEKGIKNGLLSIIEANPSSFNLVAEDPKLKIKSDILDLVTKRIISTTNSGYFRGKDQIAFDLDSMVSYMEDPHNQPSVIQFKQELASKK